MHDNIAITTRFVTEFLGRGDHEAADATLHDGVQGVTGLKPSGPIDGRDEYKATIAAFVDAFPSEGDLEIIDQFESADGTRVVTRFHSRQRHDKPFFGIERSGHPVRRDARDAPAGRPDRREHRLCHQSRIRDADGPRPDPHDPSLGA